MTVQTSSHYIFSIISDLRNTYLSPELDCGPLTNDPKMAGLFKKDTDAALDYTLGQQPFNGQLPPMAPVMSAFSTVAEKVVAGVTIEARQRFLSELKFYVHGACVPYCHFIGTTEKMTSLLSKAFWHSAKPVAVAAHQLP
jgi:hypothetical protein